MADFPRYPKKDFTSSMNLLGRDPAGSGQVLRVSGQSILDAAVDELVKSGAMVERIDTLTELLATDYDSGVYVITGGGSVLFDGNQSIYRVSDPGSGGTVMANGNEAVKLMDAVVKGTDPDQVPTNADLYVDSIEDLPPVVVGQQIRTAGYHSGATVGGLNPGKGIALGRHNGVTLFDPNRAAEIGTAAYYVNSGIDVPCWERVGISEINNSMAGFSESSSSSVNAAAWIAAITVADALKVPNTIDGGSFDCDKVVFAPSNRGLKVIGAGFDRTIINSKSVGDISFAILRADKFSDYVTVKDFTINGEIETRGGNAATRTLIQTNYSEIGYKAVGHSVSNTDIVGLVCDFSGQAEGRTDGGANYTLNSVRYRNNAIKSSGNAYINGVAGVSASNSLVSDDINTTLTANLSPTDTVIPVTNASSYEEYDRIEIGDFGGDIDVRTIVSISSNNITVDSGLTYSHSIGDEVKLPNVSNSFRGTVETGNIIVKDAIGFNLFDCYLEEAKIILRGRLENVNIFGVSSREVNPVILVDTVDRFSNISIKDNDCGFQVLINVENRASAINERLDLYNFPEIEISGSTRAQNKITLNNGEYFLTSIKVSRNFNLDATDRYQTMMEFSGFYISVAGSTTTDTGMQFHMDATTFGGFDGYSMDFTNTVRRATGGICGIQKVSGYGYTDGVFSASETTYLDEYPQGTAAGGRVDMNLSGDTARVTTRYLGETGSNVTEFVSSGIVTHMI